MDTISLLFFLASNINFTVWCMAYLQLYLEQKFVYASQFCVSNSKSLFRQGFKKGTQGGPLHFHIPKKIKNNKSGKN